VKPLFYLPRAILIFTACALAGMLSACGQIGPLYMPRIPADPDAPAVAAPPPQMSTPRYNVSPILPAYTPNSVTH
jgi:predicted small lipoprotein YifL